MTRKRSLRLWRWGLAGLLVLLTAVIAACSAGGSHVLIAQYNDDFEAELFLLEIGDDEDDWQSLGDDLVPGRSYFGSNLAVFAPEDPEYVIIYYNNRGDLVIEVLKVGDDKPQEIHEINGDFAFPRIVSDPFRILISEFDGDENECYVSTRGADADRIAKAASCDFFEDGLLLTERKRGEVTATVVDYDGEEVGVFLDDIEDADIYGVNTDLSRLLYVERDGSGGQIFIATLDEEPEEFGDKFDIISLLGFLDDELFYYIGSEDEKDDLVLFISDQDDPVAEDIDTTLRPRVDIDSGNMTYLVDSRGDQVLYVYNTGAAESIEVAEEEEFRNIEFIKTDPPRLLSTALDRDELKIYSSDMDGSDTVELFAADDVTINGVFYQEEGDYLLILYEQDDEQSLYLTPVDAKEGTTLLEGWSWLNTLAGNGETLVFAAKEDVGDAPVLYSINLEDGATEIELDDDVDDEQMILNAFLSKNGRDVLYTVRDAIDYDPDHSEVRQASLNGEESPETLFDKSELIDVQWIPSRYLIFRP